MNPAVGSIRTSSSLRRKRIVIIKGARRNATKLASMLRQDAPRSTRTELMKDRHGTALRTGYRIAFLAAFIGTGLLLVSCAPKGDSALRREIAERHRSQKGRLPFNTIYSLKFMDGKIVAARCEIRLTGKPIEYIEYAASPKWQGGVGSYWSCSRILDRAEKRIDIPWHTKSFFDRLLDEGDMCLVGGYAVYRLKEDGIGWPFHTPIQEIGIERLSGRRVWSMTYVGPYVSRLTYVANIESRCLHSLLAKAGHHWVESEAQMDDGVRRWIGCSPDLMTAAPWLRKLVGDSIGDTVPMTRTGSNP